MSVLRFLALALVIGLGSILPAAAQQPHWLLGTWEGELKNAPQSPLGNVRTMKVVSVSADGTSAQGTYGGQAGTVNITLAIAGDSVTFTTMGNQGSTNKLTRKGATLEGTWNHGASGRNGAMILSKK
jgi:hypothetical protein